jgi:anthranilate synthase component 1
MHLEGRNHEQKIGTVEVITKKENFRTIAADAVPGTRIPVEVRVVVKDPWIAYRCAQSDAGGVYFEISGG